MKKLIRTSIAAFTVLCCVSAAAIPAMAGSTPSNASKDYEPYVAPVPVTDGSYHYTNKQAATEKLNANNFSGKKVDNKTNAVYNVYDANGNLVPATLSTDGHWYIVPTNEGYTLIATGK